VRAILLYEQSFDDANLDDPASVELLDLERNHPAAIHSFKDLDAIPHPLSRRRPIFPRSLPASVTHGAATVVFLIDTDGHARLPRVLAASDPAFGYAATQAVASWIFDPPTIQSHAVVARAQIPIAFAVAPPAK
jgi:outer membrane biosynthesis protein TonB